MPLAIDLSGRRCLVVGGGRIGARKALTLMHAGALVKVLSPEISSRLESAVSSGGVEWEQGAYSPGCVAGNFLVVAATGDPELNLAIREDCEKSGVLCCVVSPGRFSRVIFPAVHRGQGLTVAVHSDGRDCAASKGLRDEIADLFTRKDAAPTELCVLGLRRNEVPEDFFASLLKVGNSMAGQNVPGYDFDEFMVLGTCERWEFWFVSRTPRVGERGVRKLVHERGGLLLETQRKALYFLSGAKARLHLVRLAAGLESTLAGEMEITGQIRSARDAFVAGDSPVLRGIVEEALGAQKSIRSATQLRPRGDGWAEHVANLVETCAPAGKGERVVIAGLSRLGERLARKLRSLKYDVAVVSRRSRRLGEGLHAPSRFLELASNAGAVVLVSPETVGPEALSRLVSSGFPQTRLIDLSSREMLENIEGLPLTGIEAAKTALAGMLAFERVLEKAPKSSYRGVLRLGARASRLSFAQVEEATRFMKRVMPHAAFEVVSMDSPGDRDKETPLPEVSEDDFFTRDLDETLVQGKIDLAVHSAKDLPSRIPSGLVVAALLPAFAPWECLVARNGASLKRLPEGAQVGISSIRRRDWLLARRPDLKACDIRGNVPERIAQLDAGRYDALILAAAGLIRLGLAESISQVFGTKEFAPAPGQGALALVTRSGDGWLREALLPLDLGDREQMPWR